MTTGHRLRRLLAAGTAAVLIAAIGQLTTAASAVAADPARPSPSTARIRSASCRRTSSGCPTRCASCRRTAPPATAPATSTPSKGNAVALFRTLGRSNLRISGNQLDRDTLWVPAGQPAPDPLPSWVADIVTAERHLPAQPVPQGDRLEVRGRHQPRALRPGAGRRRGAQPVRASSATGCPAPSAATSPTTTPATGTGPRPTASPSTRRTGRRAPTWWAATGSPHPT